MHAANAQPSPSASSLSLSPSLSAVSTSSITHHRDKLEVRNQGPRPSPFSSLPPTLPLSPLPSLLLPHLFTLVWSSAESATPDWPPRPPPTFPTHPPPPSPNPGSRCRRRDVTEACFSADPSATQRPCLSLLVHFFSLRVNMDMRLSSAAVDELNQRLFEVLSRCTCGKKQNFAKVTDFFFFFKPIRGWL